MTTTPAPAASASGARRWWHAHPAGLVVGVAFAATAMTPSLIPRDWLFQGLASGVTGGAGYGVGVAGAGAVRRLARRRPGGERLALRLGERGRRRAWAVLLVVLAVELVVVLVVSAGWQRQLSDLMGMEETTTSRWLRAGPVTVVIAAAMVAAARAVRRLAHTVARGLRRLRVPAGAALALAAVAVTVVVLAAGTRVVTGLALAVADQAFSAADDALVPDLDPPAVPTRSGSPASLVPWRSLGAEGRLFVTGGRPAAQMAQASGRRAVAPVRAYAGLDSAQDLAGRARLATDDLVRAGGLQRSVVVVTVGSGTGWVDPNAVDSLELVHGGDTAVVAMQYSYLPSALSLVVDRGRSEQAGRLLLADVRRRVDALPPQRRPQVVVYGESLGVIGTEAPFTSVADLRERTDGALWAGPPSFSPLWSSLVDRRDPGTREVAPVYSSGLVVRFATRPGGEDRPAGAPWLDPRVLYLQHPSDPVVWWSPSLVWQRPDWLAENRGYDVLPQMRWYPLVTFWQVTTDLARAQSVPDGHGHNYGDEIVDAWVAVDPPPGWTVADTALAREQFILGLPG